eukprot:CAMPEP_0202725140 /NCGR_PEP_ID=MMETSP1385-20130828/179605_1 /ASSEMBLY_ACC=CAM_ASM_000861 /TAXON_ID=933848 /ORGANISM="Elphidium margaritaceum" /LENGTH=271 /DNA_ID=CAMNT_0049391061 /DNA_START=36 /DNA_END=851 /DNA_ORIENTATION=-
MTHFNTGSDHKKVLPYVICVEGNIGSGKSTLLENLKHKGFTVIPEPVSEIWGQYLPRLYSDLKRWGFCFQMEAMDWFRQLQSTQFEHLMRSRDRVDNTPAAATHSAIECKQEEANDKENDRNSMNTLQSKTPPLLQEKIIIVERSMDSALHIFAKNLLETQLMSDWEYSLLQRFHSVIAWQPMHILYLRVEPTECSKRIEQRNRSGENKVDPKLIQNLHARHEEMFNRKANNKMDKSKDTAQNIIVVNGHQKADGVLLQTLRKIADLEQML